MNLLEVLAIHAAQRTNQLALADQWSEVTYGDLWAGILTVAAFMSNSDIGPGDVVGLALEPTVPGVAVLLGVIATGAVAAPINTRLRPSEVADYLSRIKPVLVIKDPQTDGASGTGLVLEDLRQARPLEKRLGLGSHRSAELPPVDEQAPAMALPTGGTTGVPKAALWSRRGLSDITISNCIHLNVRAADRELYISPLFHITVVAGLMPTLYAGGSVRILGRFDSRSAADAFRQWRPTRVLTTPAAFRRLVSHFPSSVRKACDPITVVYGASRSGPDFRGLALEKLPAARLITGYGATEYGPVTRLFPDDVQADVNGAVGHPVAGVRVTIAGPDGTPLPPGQVGELLIRAPWQMSGYLGGTENPFTADGSIRSGDLGWADVDGCLHLSGRSKEMIKSGGENVFPAEVENVLQEHPTVSDVGVFGRPDETWGERVEAAVVLSPGSALDREALRVWCAERLAGFKVPKVFTVVEDLPYTANMKLDRRRLACEDA